MNHERARIPPQANRNLMLREIRPTNRGWTGNAARPLDPGGVTHGEISVRPQGSRESARKEIGVKTQLEALGRVGSQALIVRISHAAESIPLPADSVVTGKRNLVRRGPD
jgi:hypothetical protein